MALYGGDVRLILQAVVHPLKRVCAPARGFTLVALQHIRRVCGVFI
jgi:hypothetical protein